MVNLLAVDTSAEACSVALTHENKLFTSFMIAERQQTKCLLPILSQLLAESGLHLKQLDAVAFVCGPGSFTGIRLAASMVQGLAFALDLPVIPISSLLALAQGAYSHAHNKPILVAVDAHRGEVYWAAYRFTKEGYAEPLMSEQCSDLHAVNVAALGEMNWVGIGNGWLVADGILAQRLGSFVSHFKTSPYSQPKDLAKLAEIAFLQGQWISPELALPSYLSSTHFWKKQTDKG